MKTDSSERISALAALLAAASMGRYGRFSQVQPDDGGTDFDLRSTMAERFSQSS
jgi:hypothetical protein